MDGWMRRTMYRIPPVWAPFTNPTSAAEFPYPACAAGEMKKGAVKL